MHTIPNALSNLQVGDVLTAGNLSVFPLMTDHGSPGGYLTLEEALAKGFVRVTEVSEAGSVPRLLLKNGGPTPVLVLDGEELVGAKQNRIVNLSILVPPATTIEIPVSCVEAGRWAARSRHFAAAGRAHYASGRAMKLAQVNANLRACGAADSDQGAVWDDISGKAARLRAQSATGAAAALYDRVRDDLDAFEDRLQPLEGQVGAVFAINGTVAGLDLFDSPDTWRKSMRKLVQSYGLDALDRCAEPRSDGRPDVRLFLVHLGEARVEAYPAIGRGTDLRFEGAGVAGAALVVDDRIVHLVAFPH